MKRFSLVLTVLMLSAFSLLASNTKTQAGTGIFQDDLSRIDQEFSGLNQLENTVDQSGQTYSQLAGEHNALLNGMAYNGDISSTLVGTAPGGERFAGIPGFIWGFCLGWVGILLVYLLIDDEASKKHEGKQAVIGCVVGSLLWIVLYFGLLASSAWWTTQ